MNKHKLELLIKQGIAYSRLSLMSKDNHYIKKANKLYRTCKHWHNELNKDVTKTYTNVNFKKAA